MVLCPDCGKEVPQAKFCRNCGSRLPDVIEVEQVVDVPEDIPVKGGSVEFDDVNVDEEVKDSPTEVVGVVPMEDIPINEEIPVETPKTSGAKGPKFCSNCGFELNGNFKFCPNCGFDLVNHVNRSVPRSSSTNKVVTATKDKNIILAIILSIIFPGLGQFYLGLDKKGALFLVGYVISLILILLFIGLILCLIVWVWALVDAIQSTNALNRGESVEDKLF